MRALSRVLDVTELALTVVCVACFVAMFGLGVATVVFRFVIESSLAFPDELIRYLFIWMIFLGSAVALRRNLHAAIGVVVTYLPALPRRAAILAATSAGIVFFAVMLHYGVKLTVQVQPQISPALEVSMAWVYGAIPAGMAFLVVYSIEMLVKQFTMPAADLLAEGQ